MLDNGATQMGEVLLKDARTKARAANIKIGKLITTRNQMGYGYYYEVYEDDHLVWEGRCDSAGWAKAKYIRSKLARGRR